ncbi:MAG: hypothetical protein R3E79_40545 [Caldilineaceae bacterium]
MQIILSDHNCVGQANAIFDFLYYQSEWLELVSMELKLFHDVGLRDTADDQIVWQLCQEQGYILLTGNRSTKDGEKSLEHQIRHLATVDCLPVLTIGNLKRVLTNRIYCRRCAESLVDIVADLHRFRGAVRLFIP